MTTTAERLSQALMTAGVSVVGVSIGLEGDRTTWRVQPSNLQASAQPVIDAFVLPSAGQLLDEDAQRETQEKKLQAVAVALWECIPSPTMTKAQLKARAVAIYKTL